MIKAVSIIDFGGLGLLENLKFDEFNIFISDNGTSKTSILEAIHNSKTIPL
jgi:AAA15 family ATPase/GTPase